MSFLPPRCCRSLENQSSNSEFFLQVLYGSPATAVIFWNLPEHVSCHFDWEPTHHPGHRLWLPPPHAHVLLFGQPALCQPEFNILHSNQDAGNCTHFSVITSHKMYFFLMFGDLDSFFLAVMAYDSYMAICHSICYSTIMSLWVSALLLASCWVFTHIVALTHTLLMAQLYSCVVGEKSYFFCDIIPVLRLSCSDTHINKLMVFALGGTELTVHFLCIVISYIHIVSAMLRVQTPGVGGSLLHLQFPSLCHLCVLWDPLQCLLVPSLCCFWRERLCSSCNVYSGDPHVEPLYLQPMEQGHEGHP